MSRGIREDPRKLDHSPEKSEKLMEEMGIRPDPWLEHFLPTQKTDYCEACGEWVVPEDSVLLWTSNLYKSKDHICPKCGSETAIMPEDYVGNLNWMWYNHSLVPYSEESNVSPLFFNVIGEAINSGKSVQLTITGGAGEGKSFFMLSLAQFFNPGMTIDQVAFEHAEFIHLARTLPTDSIICVDETSYLAGKRTWANLGQQQMMLIWESMRFRLLPVFSTVINISLYDKKLREHLIIYQCNMTERGVARCYRLHPHPFEDYVGHQFVQQLYLQMPDWNFCQKSSCLKPRCSHLGECPLLRGKYEMKKDHIQARRYRDAEESFEMRRTRSFYDWLEDFLKVEDKCYFEKAGKRKLSTEVIMMELGCSSGMAAALRIARQTKSREELLTMLERRKNA